MVNVCWALPALCIFASLATFALDENGTKPAQPNDPEANDARNLIATDDDVGTSSRPMTMTPDDVTDPGNTASPNDRVSTSNDEDTGRSTQIPENFIEDDNVENYVGLDDVTTGQMAPGDSLSNSNFATKLGNSLETSESNAHQNSSGNLASAPDAPDNSSEATTSDLPSRLVTGDDPLTSDLTGGIPTSSESPANCNESLTLGQEEGGCFEEGTVENADNTTSNSSSSGNSSSNSSSSSNNSNSSSPMPPEGARPGQGWGSGGGSRGSISMDVVRKVRTIVPIFSAVISVTGIVLDVPSLAVFCRMSHSVGNGYMQILLLLDTVCLVVSLPMATVEIVYHDLRFLPIPYAFYRLYFSLILLIGTRHVIYVITSLMSVDRCLSIIFPLMSKNPLRHPRVLTGVVAVLVFAFTIPELAFRLEVKETVDEATNTTYGQIGLTPTFFANIQLYSRIFLVSNILLRYIPVSLLVASNVALLVSLILHARRMRAFGIEDETNQRRANVMRSVKVVVVYSFVFLMLGLPFTVYLVLDTAMPQLRASEPNLDGLISVIFPFLDVLSSATNFFVYFAVHTLFKKGFKAIMCRPCSNQ